MEIRTIDESELEPYVAAVSAGFLNPRGDRDAEVFRPGTVFERSWAAFDGATIAATTRSFPAELTLPGGELLAVSAVTAVTTRTTYRRQGLASRLVRTELAASVDRGEAASVLIPVEWPIYGRFGYGAATEHQTYAVDTGRARLRHRPQGTVEFVDEPTARSVAPDLYDRYRRATPGELSRRDGSWDLEFGIVAIPSRGTPKPAFTVLARDPAGEVVGLARYRCELTWENRQPQGSVDVLSMVTTTPAADALLWEHLLAIDLATSVRAGDRAADDPLPWLLTDARLARQSTRADFLWLRPLNVVKLLESRAYAGTDRVVLEVRDTDGFAAGRYALDTGPDGATCTPSTATADLTLDVAVLGSVCLGGFALTALARAGLVDEHTPNATERAGAMFRTGRAPWCTTWF